MRTRLLPPAVLAGALLVATPGVASAEAATAHAPRPAAYVAAAEAAAAGLPSKTQWYADVRAALSGSQVYVADRAAAAASGEHLALNLDIDNTSLATQMDHMKPIPKMQRLVGVALDNDVTVLFNTGRLRGHLADVTRKLRAAGFQPTEVCGRYADEGLSHSKQRCRARFVREGYTLIANVGNNDTDFYGGDYEKAYKLPNYGGRLH